MRTFWDNILKFMVISLLICLPLMPSCLAGISLDGIEGIGGASEEEEIEEEIEEEVPLPVASFKLVRLDGTELELGDTPIPRAVKVRVAFDRALTEIERAALESGIALKQGNVSLGVSFDWSEDYTQVIVTPARWFDYGTTYTLTISSEVVTLAAQIAKAEGVQGLSFTTAQWGDVNGDGSSDVIVGAYTVADGGVNRGGAYVFTAGSDCNMFTGCVPHATFTGAADGNELGHSVSMAGDVNADGYGDIIIGAYGAENWKGQAYIFYGSDSGVSGCDLPANCADTTITGAAADDQLGFSVSDAGDVNGDGYDDVIVGANYVGNEAGQAYVFYGSGSGVITDPGTTLTAAADFDDFGESVSGAGDVNGDGYDDVIVGARYVGNDAGQAYVFLGSENGIGDCSVSSPDCADATITPANDSEELGESVSGAGDVNGDGYDDVIVGAYLALGGDGQAYVLHGSASGISDCNLSAIPPCTPDATISADAAAEDLGYSVSGAGDVNGDGYDDVIVGAPGSENRKGQTYVLHGSADGISDCDLASCTPDTTITGEVAYLHPIQGDKIGSTVSRAGDVNGDGYDDIIVGALGPDDWTGQAYVFHGSGSGLADGASTCDLFGCAPDATLTGANVDDRFGLVR